MAISLCCSLHGYLRNGMLILKESFKIPLSVIMLRILAISVSAPVGQFSTNCKSSGDAIPIARTYGQSNQR